MNIFKDWPHDWYGVWKESRATRGNVPVLSDLVDKTWNPTDLAEILRYLREAPVALASGLPSEACCVCGEIIENVGSQQSDGTWCWMSSLSHFVEKHQIRLPDRLVEHIRASGYRPSLLPENAAGDPI